MKIALKVCLENRKNELGDQCEKLGKTSGFFGLGRKVYLSYSKDKGWEVVKLNIIERIFRSFGAYESTRLNRVARKIVKDAPDEVTKFVLSKILSKWRHKYISIIGNCNIGEAKVIGFPEKHTDQVYRAAASQIFSEQHQKGDVILVESLEAGKKSKTESFSMTKFLTPELKIRGWEPKNFAEKRGPSYANSIKKEKDLSDQIENFLMLIVKNFIPEEEASLEIIKNPKHLLARLMNKTYSEEAILEIEKKLPEFILKIEEMNRYYKLKGNFVKDASKTLQTTFNTFKTSSSSEKTVSLFSFIIEFLRILSIFEKARDLAYFKDMQEEDRKLTSEGFSDRDVSLAGEINKYREKGKRVFVFAGAAHLIFKGLPIQKLQECLAKEKHALVTLKYGYN